MFWFRRGRYRELMDTSERVYSNRTTYSSPADLLLQAEPRILSPRRGAAVLPLSQESCFAFKRTSPGERAVLFCFLPFFALSLSLFPSSLRRPRPPRPPPPQPVVPADFRGNPRNGSAVLFRRLPLGPAAGSEKRNELRRASARRMFKIPINLPTHLPTHVYTYIHIRGRRRSKAPVHGSCDRGCDNARD